MQKVAIGVVAGLGIWLGSVASAEAQSGSIVPIGPTQVVAGATSTTYSATVTLPSPSGHWIRVQLYKNGSEIHNSNNFVPNPGVTIYTYNKFINLSSSIPAAGDTLVFKAKLTVAGTPYYAQDWTITVSGTYPQTFHALPADTLEFAGGVSREAIEERRWSLEA